MSWLETELREQPEALARLLERQTESARTAARLFHRRDLRYLVIASRGSSSNVARYAQYLLGRAHRVPVISRRRPCTRSTVSPRVWTVLS